METLPVVSMEEVTEIVDGDMELFKEIVDLFLETTPALIATIHEAVIGEDMETLRNMAHSLKGSAANIGALSLRYLSYEIENAATENDLGEARRLAKHLQNEMENLKKALNEIDFENI